MVRTTTPHNTAVCAQTVIYHLLNLCAYLAFQDHVYVVHMLICPLVPYGVAIYARIRIVSH